jgi:hypothetical protein
VDDTSKDCAQYIWAASWNAGGVQGNKIWNISIAITANTIL